MSTPFLEGFATLLVQRLVAEGLLEVGAAGPDAAAADLAASLAGLQHQSLRPSIVKGLLGSEHVVELFADDEQLGAVLDDLVPQGTRSLYKPLRSTPQ